MAQTRQTILPGFETLHIWLTERASFYRMWHTHPHCHKIHWTILAIAVCVVLLKVAAAILPLIIPSPVLSSFQ